jgi:hypothetical protein
VSGTAAAIKKTVLKNTEREKTENKATLQKCKYVLSGNGENIL